MRHPRCTRGRLVHNVLIHHKKEDCRRSVLGAISVPGSTRIGSPMARVFQSLITRANSQLIPCRADKAKLSQWPRRRVDLDGCEIQSFFAIQVVCDSQPIARQGLMMHDLARSLAKCFSGVRLPDLACKCMSPLC